MKPIRRLQAVLLGALLFFAATVPSSVEAQLNLNFTNSTQITGTTPTTNARYLYTNVASGYDCIVTIVALSGSATISNIDDNATSPNRFQPIINQPLTTNANAYARFRFQLITAGSYSTTNPNGSATTPSQPIWFRAFDTDGDGQTNGVREFVEFSSNFTGAWVDIPSRLIAKTPLVLTGGDGYIAAISDSNGAGVSDDPAYACNAFIYGNTTSTWDIIGGSVSGSNAPDAQAAARRNSWSFIASEVLPGLDLGDNPIIYEGAAPVVPAFHVKPTVDANVNVYLGSIKPDLDYNPSGNTTATVDDANASPDDEDGFASPFFPFYSGTGNYTFNVNVTNTSGAAAYLYGYIDFNGDGDFADANERSALVTINSAASLQTVAVTFTAGFTYNASSTTRYARFRVGSSQTQVSTPTGPASNGEVEDYSFNTFRAISGTIFNDVNGLQGAPINTVDGTPIGRPAAATLYINLLNAAGTAVVDTVTVRADGTYTLNTGVASGSYILQLSTVKGTIGSTPPAASLPAGWANTGEFLGTGTGNDGTVSGTLPINIATTNIANGNFGIDARPVAGSGVNGIVNFTTQTQINVPATTFTNTAVSSDAAPGGVTGIRIIAIPTGANTIVINGTTYGPGFTPFPAAGIIVPTDGNGSPLQTITVDPTATGTTTVTIRFVARDAAGVESSNIGTAVLDLPTPIVVSGTIFDDGNGLIGTPANTVDGTPTGTAGGTPLYLNLVGTGNLSFVLDTFRVNANGTYSFEAAPNKSYTLRLSTTRGTIEAPPDANTLTPGWVFTGENVGAGAGNDGSDGILTLNVGTANITNANFGIEAIPVGLDKTLAAVPNPGGTARVQIPASAFTATDVEDAPGGYPNNLTGRTVTLDPNSSTGLIYYNGVQVNINGETFTNFNPALVTYDPAANGATTGIFTYSVLDNAGRASVANTVQVPFSELSISGTVFNDPNTDGVVNGTPANFVGANTLYAILLNGTTIVSSQAIGSSGTAGAYSFNTTNGVVAGTSYNVIISNSPTSIAPALTGALFNSETDGTPNGSITLSAVAASVSGQNFGISLAGYIYVQKKTLDESSSVDFTFTGSGGIGNIVVNDNPTQIALRDIGSSAGGRLYGIGTTTNNLFYRDLGSSIWVNTGITGITRVDGGPANQCYLISTAGSVLLYSGTGTTTTIIGAPANYGTSNATDIGSPWDNTPYVVTASGALYKYSGTGTTWAQVGTSTNNRFVDGFPVGNGVVVSKTDNSVFRITAANAETSLGTPAGVTGQALDVGVDQTGSIYSSYRTPGFSNGIVYKWTSGTSWSSGELTSNIHLITGGVGSQVWGTTTQFGNTEPYGNIYTRTNNGTSIQWLDDERVRTTANANSQMKAVVPGTYTITETVPSGWSLDTIIVADPTANSSANVTSALATVAVAAGETVAAVFTNVFNTSFPIVNNCASQYLETFGTGATGTFGAPLIGQTSYHHLAIPTSAEDGYYKVVSYARDWATYADATTNFDHTTNDGNGRFMAVNAGYDRNDFFRRRFTGLIVGATYNLSSYLINISNNTIKPNVRFVVQNPADRSIIASTSSGDITTSGVWAQYGLSFVATTSTVDVSLVNNGLGGQGNDLGLDDISFKLIAPTGTLTATAANGNCSTAGTITVTAPLGSLYEYSINGTTFQASPTFTNVAAGNYTITARYVGSTGCALTAPVTLNPTICGNVFNDVNGNVIKEGTEPFITNGSVYANLVNPATDDVIQSVQVAADGSYAFNTLTSGTSYRIILSTTSQTGNLNLTTATLPAGFVNTGVNLGGTANTGNLTGIINITATAANLINQNFAIEALPVAGSGVNSAANPGTTLQVTVPANTFTNTTASNDPAPGGVTSIRITAFPTGVTSIVINGVTYTTSNVAALTALIITTDGNGAPVSPFTITVDPATDATPSVTIPFVARDDAGKESVNTGTAVLNLLAPISISGNVFNDVNGDAVKQTLEVITGGVYANLVNPTTNTVIQSVLVNTTGDYTFNNASQNTAYRVVLTNNSQTVGASLTASTLPTGFANTGVNLGGTANTGNQTGIISFTTAGVNLTAQNFGIEALPFAGNGTNNATNPGGTTEVIVSANTFTNGAISTDPVPGGLTGTGTGIRITAFPSGATSIRIGTITYFPADVAALTALIIPTDAFGNPTPTIAVDPALATTPNVTIPFKARDAAGKESTNTGNAVLNLLAPITVSGSVFNDVNGDAILNGSDVIITNGSVYANLVDASNAVLQSVVVNGSGNYTFNTVSQNTTYSVVLTNSSQTVGATLTTATLPAGFVNTGVNLAGTANTGNQTGIISFTTAAVNLTAQNFGIEALPVAGSGSNSATNPTGTIQVPIPANTFTNTTLSSDPSPGGLTGTGTGIRITALPTGVTSIVINNVTYTSANVAALTALVIPTDANGNPTVTISVDPSATGVTTVTIPFVARDAAGKESANTGNAVLNLIAPVTISGSVFDDPNGNAATDGGEPFITNGSVYANLVNPVTNTVLQSVQVDGTGNYSFANASQNTAYRIVVTNNSQTVGASLTAATLPAGFVNTGVNLNGIANTVNQNGIIALTTATANVTAQNFAIEALPVAGSGSNTATNRGGTTQTPVPANTFNNTSASSDAAPGAVTGIRITALPTGVTSIVINGVTYTSANVAALTALIIPTDANGDPTFTITVDAAAIGATTVTIPFVARDAAGRESTNTGIATLNLLTPVSISGNVFNDVNGNAVFDGVDQYITNGSVYANLVNASTNAVLQSVVVDVTGNYTFAAVSQNTGFNIILSSSSQAGNPNLTAATLPAGFVNTGVNLGGTANTANQSGIISLTTGAVNITAQNFGIEAVPTAGSGIYTTTNLGGTVQLPIPASAFTGTTASSDPTPGSITGIRITAFPTGVTSIVINGITYTTANAAALTALIIPTDINGNPTVTITVDPAVDGATSITLPFVARDAAGKESTSTGTALLNLLAPVSISGNVFDDGNGNAIKDVAEPFITNGSVYANLVNPTTNAVLQSVQVDGTGSYTFNGASQNTAYRVVLTNSSQTVNSTLTAATLPAGFVNTGVNVNGTSSVLNQTGIISLTTGTGNLTAQNFAIDATPTVANYTASGLSNPGATATIIVPVAAFTGSDPEDLTYGTGLNGRTVILSPGTGGTLFYNGVSVTPNTTITNFNPALVTFDPAANGATTGTFSYNVLDNAGRPSATFATITLQFVDLTISGIVFNDPNTTPAVDGTPAGVIGNNNLFAILVNDNTIVASQPVAANGTYSFGTANGVVAGTNYSIVISNTDAGITPTLTGAVYNSETDGTADGAITLTNLTSSTTNQNFGIDRLPTVNSFTAVSIANPGGTVAVVVPAAAFTGSDPEDGAYTNFTNRRVALGAGVNGTLYYNGTPVGAGGTIVTNFNPALLTFDPTANGTTTGSFSVNVYDNADKPSATPAIISLPFADLTITGIVFNDPDANGIVDGVSGGIIGANTLYAVLLDASNNFIARKAVDPSNGSYSFGSADGVVNGGSYNIIITNGNTAVVPALIGAAYNSEADGTVNGSISVTNVTASVSGQNFGIDQLPVVTSSTAISVANPGGTNTVAVPASSFNGSDPEDGTYTLGLSGRKVSLSPGVNGNLFYNGVLVTVETVIVSFDPALVRFDPNTGVAAGTFNFNLYDNADKPALTPATITLPFSDLTISGTVFNDPNTTAVVDGTATGTIGGNVLYVLLYNASGNIIARKPVDPITGTYSFGTSDGITSGSSYGIVLVNGSTANLPGLAAGTAYNSESDGFANGIDTIINVITDRPNRNFGIDLLPVSDAFELPLQLNPGGTGVIPIVATLFGGSDPEDDVYPNNLTGRTVTLASGVNGSVYYNGVIVPTGAGTTIPNFNPALVTFDPANGTNVATFTYSVFDNANKPSAPATVTIPFRLGVTIAGTIWNDVNGNANNDITETLLAVPATMFANIVSTSGVIIQSVPVVNGAYTTGLVFADSAFNVILTNTIQTPGSLLSVADVPGGWVLTGVNPGATTGTANTANRSGILPVSTAGVTTGVIARNFGIERIPVANNATTPAQANFAPYTQSVVATSFTGNDFDGGLVQFLRITAFPTNAETIVIGGTTYTSSNFPLGGVTITALPNGNPVPAISVKPNANVPFVNIPYVTVDNAGAVSVGATVTIPYFVILPVTGLDLIAIRNGNDVVLKWSTLTEQNTSHFLVERSYNGSSFETIGSLQASNNSNALKSYSTIDKNVVRDLVYYRITLLDKDGRKSVSNTVTVRLSGFVKNHRVFPNPVRDMINVELSRAGRYNITLYNGAGQQIATRLVDAGSSMITNLNRNNLPAGSYILKVQDAKTKESEIFKLILE